MRCRSLVYPCLISDASNSSPKSEQLGIIRWEKWRKWEHMSHFPSISLEAISTSTGGVLLFWRHWKFLQAWHEASRVIASHAACPASCHAITIPCSISTCQLGIASCWRLRKWTWHSLNLQHFQWWLQWKHVTILPGLPRQESDFAFCLLNSSEIMALAIHK